MTKIRKLALDAGHGWKNSGSGFDTGATSAGYTEAGICMDWVETAKFFALKASVPVFLVRTGMTDANPVGGRDEQAEAAGCSHFLSFHLNSSDSASASGSECYFRDAKDKAFGKVVHAATITGLHTKDRGMKGETESQHPRLAIFDFDGPACLEEIGFISNSKDRSLITKDEYRIATCRGIILALVDAFGIEED